METLTTTHTDLFTPDKLLLPTAPNLPVGNNGRIVTIREDFESEAALVKILIVSHKALDRLIFREWPALINSGDYDFFYDYPKSVSEPIEHAFSIAMNLTRHLFETLDKMDDSIHYTTFTDYVNFVTKEIELGYGYDPTELNLIRDIEKIIKENNLYTCALIGWMDLYTRVLNIRGRIINWIGLAKDTALYKINDASAVKRQHIESENIIEQPNESDGVYGNRIRFRGVECDILSGTQLKIYEYMLDNRTASKVDVALFAWGISDTENRSIRSMLTKMNHNLKSCSIPIHFYLRKGLIEKHVL